MNGCPLLGATKLAWMAAPGVSGTSGLKRCTECEWPVLVVSKRCEKSGLLPGDVIRISQ
ncbi:hypothetical protein SPMU_23730 [Sphingomonas mucosissima]|uniref:Uncharacterized protein n=1 Tax=Sphingomonas mucosissima TaxID=370959 RepID=A0A245ZJN1_9SPHN|nr:hypothetical protein SPMU_23730 [Sphingomonas mucosissima]